MSEAQSSAFSSIASGAISLQLQLTADAAQPDALNGSVPAGNTRITVQLLRWLSTAVQRGASSRYADQQSRLEAALDVRRLHASLEAGLRQQSAADAVVVVLHLLQPLIAEAFGLSDGGVSHSLQRAPEENGARASEQPEATEQVWGPQDCCMGSSTRSGASSWGTPSSGCWTEPGCPGSEAAAASGQTRASEYGTARLVAAVLLKMKGLCLTLLGTSTSLNSPAVE